MSLILLVAILPIISTVLITRFGLEAAKKDLAIARTSIVFMTTGFLLIAISPSAATMIIGMPYPYLKSPSPFDRLLTLIGLMIYTFGTGFSAAVRSVVTLMVAPEHVPRLYTFIALADTVGVLIAGPFLSFTYHFALSLGGAWLGLPFLISAALLAAVGLLVFSVRTPRLADGGSGRGVDKGKA